MTAPDRSIGGPTAVVLTLVLLTAGCLTGTGPTTEPGPPEADWATDTGVNTTALARAHFAALRSAGNFSENHSETVRVNGDPRPAAARPDAYHPPNYVVRRVDLKDGRYLDSYVTVGHRQSNHFVTPEVTARRESPCPDCPYEYHYGERPAGDVLSKRLDRYRSGETVTRFARILRGVTVGFEYSYAGTEAVDGKVLYRYRATRELNITPPLFDTPPRGTATILLTEAGVVRRFTLRYVGRASVSIDGRERSINVSHTFIRTYSDVGETSVGRPPWVARATGSDPPRSTVTDTS